MVRSNAYRLNDTLVAQLVQSRVGSIHCLFDVSFGIVNVYDIQTVDPEPPKTFLDGSHGAFIAEVNDGPQGRGILEGEIDILSTQFFRHQAISSFRAEDERGAPHSG